MTSLIKFNGNEKRLGFPVFPSLFDDSLIKDLFDFRGPDLSETMPAVNIKETQNFYELEMAVPGMSKEDFKIELDNGTLLISADHKTSAESNSDRYHKKEFNFRSFKRVFQLPEDVVNEDEIKASYADGILNVSVAKKETATKYLKEIPVE